MGTETEGQMQKKPATLRVTSFFYIEHETRFELAARVGVRARSTGPALLRITRSSLAIRPQVGTALKPEGLE